jgi:hypothetical protein
VGKNISQIVETIEKATVRFWSTEFQVS